MNLSTTYLGLRLAHPFMVGASPLADTLDAVKRLEDEGSAAIVLRSLFEEQISLADSGLIHHMDPFEAQFAERLAEFPPPERYPLAPDQYLDHLRRAKAAVSVPLIASLNGMTGETWLEFATKIQQAGADALEVNIYEIATGPNESGAAIEKEICDAIRELKRRLRIPVAIKLGPFFTAFGHVAQQLDRAGADGLVLFNRFYQSDVDVETMAATPRLELSTSAELLLRLRWTAILHRRLRASIAITGGVATPTDGIKAILSGAHAVQVVSAILRHGPEHFAVLRDGLARWMESKHLASLEDVRGKADGGSGDTSLWERGSYIRTLQSWSDRG